MPLTLKSTLDIPGATTGSFSEQERQQLQKIPEFYRQICGSLHQSIVGLDETIEHIIIGILSGGHALLVGVPGLAKTLLIRTLSELLELRFSRIQFTPDLMPSDITGTEILVEDEQQKNRQFAFFHGPIFANIVLADEINRTPPKTQAALLEAMEEHTVTSMGQRFVLDPPFFVLATQNPIEQEGTYPLPVSQQDRFMFNLLLDYPSAEDERQIMRLTLPQEMGKHTPLLNKEQILQLLKQVRKVEIAEDVMEYTVALCRISRPHDPNPPVPGYIDRLPTPQHHHQLKQLQWMQKTIQEHVNWGVGPRAAQCLILGGKARALLYGRTEVTAADIRAILHPVLRHRLLLNYRAEADGITPDRLIDQLITHVYAPDGVCNLPTVHQYSQKLYLSHTS